MVPPKIAEIVGPRQIGVGGNMTLTCHIEEGIPQPAVSWMFKGKTLQVSSTIRRTMLTNNMTHY
jgi:hypothetical protein